MKETLHIAMYPWFAMGHITSFMHLANKLAENGHQISFLIPTKTQIKVASHNHHPTLITFIPIVVPHIDGLLVGAETTNDVPASVGPKIAEAMDLTQDTIDSHMSQLKPDYIFFDFAHWLPKLARKHEVKSLYYTSTYTITLAYFCHRSQGILETKPEIYNVNEEDLLVAPPGFPCSAIRLRRYEARALVYMLSMNYGEGMTLSKRQNICYEE
ncbi:hypothetical protein vseg_020225 [Gypsophila vaccaria]